MNRQLVMAGLLVASFVAPQHLRAQSSFLVAGGINAPVGTLGDIADLGYNVAVGLAIGGPIVPVGLAAAVMSASSPVQRTLSSTSDRKATRRISSVDWVSTIAA